MIRTTGAPSDSLVVLNVGGRRFYTTRSTLQSRPGFLCNLVDEGFAAGVGRLRDETGALFIDRDGDLFSRVLEFLRTGKRPEGIDDELRFYGLMDEDHKAKALSNEIIHELLRDKYEKGIQAFRDANEAAIKLMLEKTMTSFRDSIEKLSIETLPYRSGLFGKNPLVSCFFVAEAAFVSLKKSPERGLEMRCSRDGKIYPALNVLESAVPVPISGEDAGGIDMISRIASEVVNIAVEHYELSLSFETFYTNSDGRLFFAVRFVWKPEGLPIKK